MTQDPRNFTRAVINDCMNAVRKVLKKNRIQASWTILIWTPGGVNYASSTERESTIKAMKELLERWEREEDIFKGHTEHVLRNPEDPKQ